MVSEYDCIKHLYYIVARVHPSLHSACFDVHILIDQRAMDMQIIEVIPPHTQHEVQNRGATVRVVADEA